MIVEKTHVWGFLLKTTSWADQSKINVEKGFWAYTRILGLIWQSWHIEYVAAKKKWLFYIIILCHVNMLFTPLLIVSSNVIYIVTFVSPPSVNHHSTQLSCCTKIKIQIYMCLFLKNLWSSKQSRLFTGDTIWARFI